jgi:hypothetical protein
MVLSIKGQESCQSQGTKNVTLELELVLDGRRHEAQTGVTKDQMWYLYPRGNKPHDH